MLRNLLAIGVCSLHLGCTALNDSLAPLEATPQVTLEEINANGAPIEGVLKDIDLSLYINALSGQIFGAPTSRPIQVFSARTKRPLQFDWTQLRARFAEQAAEHKLHRFSIGLLVSPASCRFARAGTFAHQSADESQTLAGGFRDPSTGEMLILLFFDRPCSIGGRVAVPNSTASFSIQATRAGFHWVRVNDSQAVVSTPTPSRVVFTVQAQQSGPSGAGGKI
jgi:hypothetical protein